MAKREEDEKDENEDERDEDSDASADDPSARDEAGEEEEEEEEEEAEAASADEPSTGKKAVVDAEYEDEDESDEDEDEDEQKAARTETAIEPADAAEEEILPTQLGANKYVYSAFFSAALITAYILGKSIHGIWAMLSNRDFFALRYPWATSIHDDTKMTYSMIAGGLIALVLAVRLVKRPSLRQWADEVAGELVKVKWPTRKEVQNSTVVVLATSAVAVTYLFLLDRFFGFLTDRIYSIGG